MSALSGKDRASSARYGPRRPAPDDHPKIQAGPRPHRSGLEARFARHPGAHFGLQLRIAQQHLLIISGFRDRAPPASGIDARATFGFWKEAARVRMHLATPPRSESRRLS